MHAEQYIRVEWLQEIQALSDARCLWAEVSLKYDHH